MKPLKKRGAESGHHSGLADAQGLSNLAETVKAYDAMIDSGIDNEFGKPIEMCEKIETGGPYYLSNSIQGI
jgi:hypothetical protein